MAKKAKSQALVAPVGQVAKIDAVEPSSDNLVTGTVASVELLPDGTKRITYQVCRSYTEQADGSKRWEYYPQ